MVRIIIERRLKKGKEREIEGLLRELRITAMRHPGFVTGQTLFGHDDPSLCLVLSTWLSAEHWRAWASSAERQAIAARVEPLLAAPEKITVFKFPEESTA